MNYSNNKIVWIIALALFGLSACRTSDQYLPEDQSQEEGVAVSFSVTKPDNETSGTKVAYPTPTSNRLVWSSEDKVGVYGYCVSFPSMSFSNIGYELESGENTPVGVFINSKFFGWYHLYWYDIYMYYPYSSNHANTNFDVAVDIPLLQTQAGPNTSDNLSANKFMYSSWKQQVIPQGGVVPIGQMSNLGSTIRFTATELAADERITAITISPNSGNADLAYKGTFNLQREELTFTEGYSSVRLEIGGGGLANGDVAYMLVNTGFAGRSFIFNFEVTSSSHTRPSVRAATRNNEINQGQTTTVFPYPNGFRPNVILDVSLSGKLSPELIADEQIWAKAGTKDLNAGKGRANCYIVGTNGKYKFNASYPGNSTLESDKFNLSGAQPYVVWASSTNLISVYPQLSDTGNMQVTTSGKTGNAVVGVRKNGVTLWSWHIWITETGTVDTFSIEGKATFQSLNLGATSSNLSDPKSYGMYYQWGRKDPFYNSSQFSWKSKKRPSVEDAIMHPEWAYANWNGNGTNDAWNLNAYNRNYRDNSWGSFGDKEYKEDDLPIAKSKYDPCPYGFRVPTKEEWPSNPYLYFPRGGYGDKVSNFNWREEGNGYYWSDVAQHHNQWGTSTDSYRFGFGRDSAWGTVPDHRYYLMSVRCVQDDIHL